MQVNNNTILCSIPDDSMIHESTESSMRRSCCSLLAMILCTPCWWYDYLLLSLSLLLFIFFKMTDDEEGGDMVIWWYGELQRRTKKNWPMYIHIIADYGDAYQYGTVEPKFCVKLNNITVQISTAYFVEVCPQCCSLIFIHLATYYFRGCRVPEFLEKLHFGRYSTVDCCTAHSRRFMYVCKSMAHDSRIKHVFCIEVP